MPKVVEIRTEPAICTIPLHQAVYCENFCGFTARDLKTNDVLRVATAHDAAALLYEMDAVLREREEKQETTQEMGSSSSADHIFSHMSAYMEVASQ